MAKKARKSTSRKSRKNATKLPRSVKRLFPQVTEAYDSDKHVDVVVEKRDAKEGKGKDPNECAMARAIKREYHADGAIIGMTFSYLIKGNKAIRFKTPDSVRTEIVSFDRHHDFAEGEYSLSPVPPTQKLGSGYSRDRYHAGGGHTPKRVIHRRHQTTNVRVLVPGSDY